MTLAFLMMCASWLLLFMAHRSLKRDHQRLVEATGGLIRNQDDAVKLTKTMLLQRNAVLQDNVALGNENARLRVELAALRSQ